VDDACLDFHALSATSEQPALAQVRRPIYRTSVARWRRYERHLGPLLAALGLEQTEACAPATAEALKRKRGEPLRGDRQIRR